jgi:hypothetical protein
MHRRPLVIAVFAMMVGAVGFAEAATTVKVVNGRGAPALVMDQTVLQPVHGNANVLLEAGQTGADLELITPPAGKMVVIEYLTIQAFVSELAANALRRSRATSARSTRSSTISTPFPRRPA